MTCPIFCIRAKDPSETRLDLVNHCGCGNALPVRSSFNDLDHRYRYSTGDVGKVAVRLQHELTLSMDEVSEAIREQLLDWKFKRMPVSLCLEPNKWAPTPDTFLQLRAQSAAAGQQIFDEANNIPFAATFSARKFVWDIAKHQMIERAENQLITEETDFGPGWRFHGYGTNKNAPGTPESATTGFGAGKAGWDIVKTGSGSVVHHADFPFVSHPGSLHVGIIGTGQVTLTIPSSHLGAVPAAGGHVMICVWVKGSVDIGTISVKTTSAVINRQYLTRKTYSEWTRFDFAIEYYLLHGTTWSIELMFTDSASVGVESDVYIGPMSVSYELSNRGAINSHWTTSNSIIDGHTGGVHSVAPISSNPNATYTIEFVIPSDRDMWNDREYFEPLMAMSLTHNIGVAFISSSTGNPSLSFKNGTDSVFPLNEILLTPGHHVWTLVADHTNSKTAFYADGKLISELLKTVATTGADDTAWIGKVGRLSGASLYFLSFREDAVAMSAADIISGHTILTAFNTVSQGTRDLAKGRWYEIVSVPQTPLIQDGDAIWMGDIKLRQVEYVGGAVWYADEEGAL